MRCCVSPRWRALVLTALSPCLLMLAGCGGGGGSSLMSGPTGTVTGKVTYKGQPVPAGCTVTFMHQEKSVPASGVTGADGSYTLSSSGKNVVLAGPHKVSVSPPAKAATTPDPSNPEAYKAMMMKGAAGAKPSAGGAEKPPFPTKYQSTETSGFSFTVKEGANTFDMDIKD